MRKKWLGVMLVVFAFAAILFFVLNRQPAEPVYQGKRLTFWITQAYFPVPQPLTGTNAGPQDESKAREAISKIGTNAIPYYISCLQARDSKIKLKLIRVAGALEMKHPWTHFGFYDYLATKKRSYALIGLEVLRTNAAPAAPALAKLLKEGEQWEVWEAADLLVNIGLQNIGALTNAMASTNSNVRRDILIALSGYGNHPLRYYVVAPALKSPEVLAANARVVVPILLDYLNNTNKPFPDCALMSLGSFCDDAATESRVIPILSKYSKGSDPTLWAGAMQSLQWGVQDGSTNALDALVALIQDKADNIRYEALMDLGSCGLSAKSAVPEIRKALDDPVFGVRNAATNALQRIEAAEGGTK